MQLDLQMHIHSAHRKGIEPPFDAFIIHERVHVFGFA
jgi:hypothetical protein